VSDNPQLDLVVSYQVARALPSAAFESSLLFIMMHCGRAVLLVARAPLVFNMAKARMSRVTIIGLDPRAQWGPVNDKGVLIDAGDTAIRTEEPATMEVKVFQLLSFDSMCSVMNILRLWKRTAAND
jgi:hypothetical protein